MSYRIETLTHGTMMLTPLRISDAPEMVHVLADSELYTFTGGEPPGLVELAARYERQLEGPAGQDQSNEEIWLNWIVRESGFGQALGLAQATITHTSLGASADLAWLIGTEHRGQSYGRHAAEMMAFWLVGQGVERHTAHIHAEHIASQRVAASIGLEDSGQLDADGEQIWIWEC